MTEIRSWEWDTPDEFYEKYGEKNNSEAWNTFLTIATFYNGLGVLLMKNLISIELVEELLSNAVFGAWNYMGVIVLDYRGRQPRHIASRDIFNGFEYLYNELAKRGTIMEDN
jgi:hypothetical protein